MTLSIRQVGRFTYRGVVTKESVVSAVPHVAAAQRPLNTTTAFYVVAAAQLQRLYRQLQSSRAAATSAQSLFIVFCDYNSLLPRR